MRMLAFRCLEQEACGTFHDQDCIFASTKLFESIYFAEYIATAFGIAFNACQHILKGNKKNRFSCGLYH